jgi:hypothetical protein
MPQRFHTENVSSFGPGLWPLERRHCGTVVAAFSSAVVWAGADGELFAVGLPRHGNSCSTAQVEPTAFERLGRGSDLAETTVRCEGLSLRFTGADVAFDFARAERWQPRDRASVAIEADWGTNRGVVDSALFCGSRPEAVPVSVVDGRWLLQQLPAQPIEGLAAGIRSRDAGRILRAAEPLMGTGSGLTPCGDDYLIGAMAALVLVEGNPDWVRWSVEGLVRRSVTRTNRFSAAFFRQIAHGSVFELLAEFIAAFAGTNREALARATAALAGFGATSGTFAALGAMDAIRELSATGQGTIGNA